MKILLAEDDPVAAKILQLTLENFGHQVHLATSGTAAWEEFTRARYRLVISDWVMPGMEGPELCRHIRERPKTDYTYFILVTATCDDREHLRQAMDAGVDDFLIKPLDRETIWMRLRVAERILDYTTQISELQDMIPICMFCKKVRDDQDYWQQIETYISLQTGSQFSHGICPDCFSDQLRRLGNGRH